MGKVITFIPLLINIFTNVAPKAFEVYKETEDMLKAIDSNDEAAILKEKQEAADTLVNLNNSVSPWKIGKSEALFVLSGVHIIKKKLFRHKDKKIVDNE